MSTRSGARSSSAAVRAAEAQTPALVAAYREATRRAGEVARMNASPDVIASTQRRADTLRESLRGTATGRKFLEREQALLDRATARAAARQTAQDVARYTRQAAQATTAAAKHQQLAETVAGARVAQLHTNISQSQRNLAGEYLRLAEMERRPYSAEWRPNQAAEARAQTRQHIATFRAHIKSFSAELPGARREFTAAVRANQAIMRAQAATHQRMAPVVAGIMAARSPMAAANSWLAAFKAHPEGQGDLLDALGALHDKYDGQYRYNGTQARSWTPFQKAFGQYIADYKVRGSRQAINNLFAVTEAAAQEAGMPLVAR